MKVSKPAYRAGALYQDLTSSLIPIQNLISVPMSIRAGPLGEISLVYWWTGVLVYWCTGDLTGEFSHINTLSRLLNWVANVAIAHALLIKTMGRCLVFDTCPFSVSASGLEFLHMNTRWKLSRLPGEPGKRAGLPRYKQALNFTLNANSGVMQA